MPGLTCGVAGLGVVGILLLLLVVVVEVVVVGGGTAGSSLAGPSPLFSSARNAYRKRVQVR